MVNKLRYQIAGKALLSAFQTVMKQPGAFFRAFNQHIWILLPLIASQLFQKLQDLVDDRLMNHLGPAALTIHNVQYSLYGLAQEVGLIAATSLLIFWKRKEMQSKQKTILSFHVGLTLVLSGIVCWFTYFHISDICHHFQVPDHHLNTAQSYLKIGLFNLMFRSLFVPVSTILIANNQRIKSIGFILALVFYKMVLALICSKLIWNGLDDVKSLTTPMLVFAGGSVVFSLGVLFLALKTTFELADGWGRFSLKHPLRVWPSEIGIGLVSALCPLLFTFQIAKANTHEGFFVTYQIALHLTCLLTLPVLAGIQVAVRDASSELSEEEAKGFKPIHRSRWWPHFFFASLVPTVSALTVAAFIPRKIIYWIYGYEVPKEHLAFLPLFFGAWILFQFGSVFIIVLRASQKNHIATRNILISGFLVQLGFTQFLLYLGVCTSFGVGLAVAASCLTFLLLNWNSVAHLYLKAKMFRQNTRSGSIATKQI